MQNVFQEPEYTGNIQRMTYLSDIEKLIVFRRSAIPADVFAEVRKFKGYGDWLFWIRMAANGRVAVIRERLNFFRKSRISVSAVNKPDEELDVFLWLCNNGFFKRRSLVWAVRIGTPLYLPIFG